MLQPFQFAAQSLVHEGQRSLTTERLINMFAEGTPGRAPFALRGAPGFSDVVEAGTTRVRGMISALGKIFAVVGNVVFDYDVASDTLTNRGFIPDGDVTMAKNRTQVAITAGSRYFIVDASTRTEVTGLAFADIGSVDFISNVFALSEVSGGKVAITALLDGTTLDALDFREAEARPDELRRIIANGGVLWLFGETTTELWNDTGNGDFPLAPLSSTVIEKGIQNVNSVTRLDNTVFFVSGEPRVYRMEGFTPQRVSTHAVEAAIERSSSDVTCFAFQYEGHEFFVVRLEDREAWVYDAATNMWHERSSGIGTPWQITATCFHEGKWYGGTSTGNIVEFGGTNERNFPLRRTAVSAPFRADGNLFTANALEARVDTGVGSTVLMRFSTDGRTFTPVRSRSAGGVGNYGQRVRWNGLGQHSEIAVELSCADDTDFAIFEASIDVG